MDTIVTPVTVITLDSTRIVHSIKADLVARYFPPVVRLVQYDQSLPVIAVSMMQNGQTYTLPSGAAANIRVHKPDSTYVYNPALGCDSTRNIVYFEVTQAMAAANGDGLAIVEIVVDGDIAGSSLITLHFEDNPVPEDAIESSDEWETIYELGERIIASTVTPVSTAAGMTDHNVVYLYTGTESGWNQGHMYYYNGTTWVDAGIAVTDTTLSVAGLAADAKATGDEITALKEDFLNSLITDTATGSIASFPDGADSVPVKSLTVDIEPVQSGSGDPSPSNVRPISGHTSAVVTRTGFNVWDEEWEIGDVDVATGQNKSSQLRLRSSYISVKPNTAYYICIDVTQTVSWFFIFFYDSNKNYLGNITPNKNTVISTLTNTAYIRFVIPDGWGGADYVGGISINYPSTDHDYHAGHVQTVTIDLDGTIYGGTLDVTSGVLTVTDANIASYNGETLPSTWISDRDVYASGTTPTTGAQVVYKLATPQTVQLTGQQLSTVLGQNNIWSDAGDVEVTYRADTKLYIEKLTAPTEDDMIADHAISSGSFFMVGNTLYRATTAIASGATITVGTNATKLSLSDALNALS